MLFENQNCLSNKLLLGKTMLKLIWSYGLSLRVYANHTSLNILQRCQSKVLRAVVNAPWYISNRTLHSDWEIPFVIDEILPIQRTNHQQRKGTSGRAIPQWSCHFKTCQNLAFRS